MVVAGGRSSLREFRDVHVLDCSEDLDCPVWSNFHEALPVSPFVRPSVRSIRPSVRQ